MTDKYDGFPIEIGRELRGRLAESEFVLIGLGGEWALGRNCEVMKAYEALYQLIGGKDYFIVTTVTDGCIYGSLLDEGRITAPCGNDHWYQCSGGCTKDIWEEGEVPDGICPHCRAVLCENTVSRAGEAYVEEGYLPKWRDYTEWLARTLNRKLLILELGEGYRTPTVIRWPFEKTAFFNRKAHMYRINEKFAQIAEELKEKVTAVPMDSTEFIRKL